MQYQILVWLIVNAKRIHKINVYKQNSHCRASIHIVITDVKPHDVISNILVTYWTMY